MNALNILPVIIVIIVAIVGCTFCYKIGYSHGDRTLALLLMSFRENSTYEVLAFSHAGNGEHTMFLKNIDKYAAYPLAAVSGQNLAYIWDIGDILTTNKEKVLLKINT